MKAWNLFLKDLEKKIGVATVEKWLYSLKVIKFDACNLYLEAQDHFQVQWFKEHIYPILKKGFYNENYHQIKIHLSIKNNVSKYLPKVEKILNLQQDDLDSSLTFSSFIASEKNLMLLKLLKELTHQGLNFNPIFIYGPRYSGKTHLLQACTHKFKEKKLNIFYVNAQTFAKHVVDAIRKGNMQEFRKIYRNLDVLIVDDIQILSKKYATQEEFFHTFNDLHSKGKKILLSANTDPNSLTDIESRLISRFEWGISLFLEKIEKKQLKIVLENQLNLLNLSLNIQVKNYILENFFSINSLKKALKTIVLKSHLDDLNSLDINTVKKYLIFLIEEEKKNYLNHEKIIYEVSIYFGITTKDILSKSQTKECSLPRQFSMYFCRQILKMPYMKIGQIFKRDHSTVMTSVKNIQSNLSSKHVDICTAFMEVSKKLNTYS